MTKKNNFKYNKNSKKIFIIKKLPLISIITVVMNAGKVLEKTLLNIFNQDYPNLEIIVVYSPSYDNTLDIIKKYQNKINKIIYNYDIGIYQSMNLGAKFATGEYINYMNAGDYFYNKNIINNIFNKKQNADVLYGDCKILYNNFSRFVKVNDLTNLVKEMCFSHQSCFVKTELQKKIGFQTKYYLSADHDFFLKIYNKKCTFKNLNKIISICKANGIVDKRRITTLFQNYLIALENCREKLDLLDRAKMINNILYHIFITFIKIIIPSFIINFLLLLKYMISKKK